MLHLVQDSLLVRSSRSIALESYGHHRLRLQMPRFHRLVYSSDILIENDKMIVPTSVPPNSNPRGFTDLPL